MESQREPALRRHQVPHIDQLFVDPVLFSAHFLRGCAMSNCDAGCCGGGVWVDLDHRSSILAHAERVRKHMSEDQDNEPTRWFDDEIIPDSDFPSGSAVGTSVSGGACVFLNRNGRCVLHIVDATEGLAIALKPFFCRIYPLALENGRLTLDEAASGDHRQCCTAAQGGDLTVFDLCPDELHFVLGSEGLQDLHALAEER